MQPGTLGPCFEVRSYILKHGGLAPTIELWRKAVPARNRISPVLTAMTSVTGAVTRFTHIWPYKSVEERGRLRAKAAEEGVWPPREDQTILPLSKSIYFSRRRSRRSADCEFTTIAFVLSRSGR